MEILGQRPVWSMSGGQMVSGLDAVYAEIARLETAALHLIAGIETTGYAQELGAGTTARLLTLRYRIDALKARRDVQLATTLPKYPAVAAALPDPNPHATATSADDAETADCDASEGAVSEGEGRQGCGRGAGVGVLLHPAQAEAIVTALEKVPSTVAADDLRVAEEELVELGRTHGPLQLRKAAKLFRDRLDTDGPEPAEDKAYHRESLQLKNADNGVAFNGYLANENAELFRTLIHAHAKPHKTIDGALDPRPRDKRQADALTTILTTANNPTTTSTATAEPAAPPAAPAAAPAAETAATSTGARTGATGATGQSDTADTTDTPADTLPGMPIDTTPPVTDTTAAPATEPSHSQSHRHGSGFIPGHGPKAHITVTIDFNDLKNATADKIGHLIYGDALSAATIRRLACDAQILPIVLGTDSQPIDVGTTVRLATGPMRKALITRDRGCVCCGAPPIYCDAHHVKSWIDGGPTAISNLVLLCKRCHRDLHAGHWNIQITNGIVHVTRPTWATPDPTPRGRYRPPTTTPHPSTPGSTTTGTSTRAWPRDTDPPWTTTDNTTRLNPWDENPDDQRTRVRTKPTTTGIDPWGDRSGSTTDASADPWRDGSGSTTDASADPWGNGSGSTTDASADPWRDGSGSTTDASVDPWGDGSGSTTDADRRNKPGTDNSTTVDPWNDLAPEPEDTAGPADDGSPPNRHTADPPPDSVDFSSTTTTAA